MSPNEESIGRFEYDQTDELTRQVALVFCQFQHLQLKKLRPWRLLPVLALALLLPALSFFALRGDNPPQDWLLSNWFLFAPLAILAFLLPLVPVFHAFTRWFVPWAPSSSGSEARASANSGRDLRRSF